MQLRLIEEVSSGLQAPRHEEVVKEEPRQGQRYNCPERRHSCHIGLLHVHRLNQTSSTTLAPSARGSLIGGRSGCRAAEGKTALKWRGAKDEGPRMWKHRRKWNVPPTPSVGATHR
ncbi:hypothetical protein SKAU_G00351430 [Synaphobranchus kaupii]|uniref:Uncharacterized protein n=1 Tax=Synaphobranchus kaupii TaxID=118154 RepID=A0A9Q1EKR9_SYNKA|nr:hypothetical protein SKAU_G00351430 [Synaphobranchus kaupii]